MADFTKDIRLKFKVDTNTLGTIEKQFANVLNVIDSSASEEFKKYQSSIKLLKTYQDALSAISDLQGENWDKERQRLQEQIEILKDYKNLDVSKGEPGEEDSRLEDLKDALTDAGDWFIGKLRKTFSNAWKEAQNLVDYGQLSSSSTRELAFSYGFTGSQAYGYQKALQLVGLNDMDDLMYANAQERQQFYEAFEKYTEKYNKLADSGFFEDLQEVQYEWQDIQEEFQMEIIQFFADNKDLIINVMRFGLKVGEFLIKALGKIVGLFDSSPSYSRSSATSDVIRNYSSNKNNNVTVKIDNTFNGMTQKDSSMYSRASEMSNASLIKSIEHL